MDITRRRLLVLLPAAAVAWEFVRAGTPEISPNYKMSDHWWGMLIDIAKCIGCGNCVRACAKENDVPEGYFRTWIERYHVTDYAIEHPQVDSPNGGKEGFPAESGSQRQELLRPQTLQPLRRFPLHAGLPRGRHLCQPRRRRAGGQELLPGLPLLRAGLPLRLPLHQSQNQTADKCTLCYHRITKGLTTACCGSLPHRRAPAGGSEESQGSDSRISAHA